MRRQGRPYDDHGISLEQQRELEVQDQRNTLQQERLYQDQARRRSELKALVERVERDHTIVSRDQLHVLAYRAAGDDICRPSRTLDRMWLSDLVQERWNQLVLDRSNQSTLGVA